MQSGAETDAELIEASRRGETAAFAQIIERYQRAVYAVSFSTVRDRALADDITQEAFVIAWRRLDDLRDTSRLPAWLCGIARNLGRDACKRRARETLDDTLDPVNALTPYDAMSEAETERIVAAALGQVPDVYREPLVLFYYEGRSVDDVARSLGISAATTNKRLSRGRRHLAERVAVVENQLARRGPSPVLAASVLAIIGITLPASHVDASPVSKGSTMHKLAIAAVVTATVGGAGVVAFTATRGDAHADASTSRAPAQTAVAHQQTGAAGEHCDSKEAFKKLLSGSRTPVLAKDSGNETTLAINDCAIVGRHLSELEADVTHGPNNRPDEATCDQCASQYKQRCESEGWSAERRACVLAAGDLMNAHLCAGGATTSETPKTDVPPSLACSVLGTHIATTVQSAGLYADVTDMNKQLESACEMGSWPIELRQCFAAATTVPALQGCVTPPQQ